MSLHDLTEFIKLSSVIHYNLSASTINRYNLFLFITDGKPLDPPGTPPKAAMLDALNVIFQAYHDRRRHLGPLAVLHPLRATALLCRALDRLPMLDLLTILLHDMLEDISPSQHPPARWVQIESQLFDLMGRLSNDDERTLTERLLLLTRVTDETYYRYVGRMLAQCHRYPEVILVKLADRLDNTLDMRIDLRDPLEGVDFYQDIFQILFVNTYPGRRPEASPHAPPLALNGARRLYQLFKNAVLLSLIRQSACAGLDPSSRMLATALCEASLREAQRTLMHLAVYHLPEVRRLRELLLEAMHYCYSGRSDLVTRPEAGGSLDGLFASYFDHSDPQVRSQRLDRLYRDKPLMIQGAIAFLTIFQSFLNDPGYYVHGISTAGIHLA